MNDDHNPVDTPETPEIPETVSVTTHSNTNESMADSNEVRADVPELTPNLNVTLTSNPLSPELNKHTAKIEAPITQLRETNDEMMALVSQHPNLAKDKIKTQNLDYWEKHVHDGHVSNTVADGLGARTTEPGTDFQQTVEHEGQQYSIRKSRFGGSFAEGGRKIDGEAALISVIQSKGQGTMVDIPLYASGVWLQIRPPVVADLAIIMQKLINNKSTWGRSTGGAIFSTSQIYMIDDLLNFVLDHVYESNLADFSPELAKELILTSDFQLIVFAMACAMYPNGYLLRQPCVHDQNNCKHVDEVSVNLGKIIWHDRSAITRQQMIHMQQGVVKKYTRAEITAYQESIPRLHPITVDLGDGITALLKIPNLQQYVISGYEWLAGIERLIKESFGESLSTKDRENRQEFISKVSIMRQYSPWIGKLILENGNTIEDPNTLDEVISTLSSDQDTVDMFDRAIAGYISKVTLSLVALPRTSCSACGTAHSEEYAKHPQLRPLDVVNTFFTLLTQRLLQVINRLDQ